MHTLAALLIIIISVAWHDCVDVKYCGTVSRWPSRWVASVLFDEMCEGDPGGGVACLVVIERREEDIEMEKVVCLNWSRSRNDLGGRGHSIESRLEDVELI